MILVSFFGDTLFGCGLKGNQKKNRSHCWGSPTKAHIFVGESNPQPGLLGHCVRHPQNEGVCVKTLGNPPPPPKKKNKERTTGLSSIDGRSKRALESVAGLNKNTLKKLTIGPVLVSSVDDGYLSYPHLVQSMKGMETQLQNRNTFACLLGKSGFGPKLLG